MQKYRNQMIEAMFWVCVVTKITESIKHRKPAKPSAERPGTPT